MQATIPSRKHFGQAGVMVGAQARLPFWKTRPDGILFQKQLVPKRGHR